MINSQAIVPLWIQTKPNKMVLNVLAVIAGSALLAILAQISIPLPFSPVPITGQTFGVALLALGWGSLRAVSSFSLYLLEGAIGLPVFALGKSGLDIGPTFGYLIGMWVASGVVGYLADKGYTKTFRSAFACCVLGSVIIFSCGLFGLSFFVPIAILLKSGLLPFIPGDFLKNIAAATIVNSLGKKIKSS